MKLDKESGAYTCTRQIKEMAKIMVRNGGDKKDGKENVGLWSAEKDKDISRNQKDKDRPEVVGGAEV